MYPVSAAFHKAVRSGEPQMPLLLFDDIVLTAEDINISGGGLRFSENMCSS